MSQILCSNLSQELSPEPSPEPSHTQYLIYCRSLHRSLCKKHLWFPLPLLCKTHCRCCDGSCHNFLLPNHHRRGPNSHLKSPCSFQNLNHFGNPHRNAHRSHLCYSHYQGIALVLSSADHPCQYHSYWYISQFHRCANGRSTYKHAH